MFFDFKNAPQIGIQLFYLGRVGSDEFVENYIALMALFTSTLSVGAVLLDIYASQKLFNVISVDSGRIICTMLVECDDIKPNVKRLQISTYKFRGVIAEALSLDTRSIEVHFPIYITKGFKIKFTVYGSKNKASKIYQLLIKNAKHKDRLPRV